MRRICPTLTSLQCFEAVARHASFTRAAAELYVTQGAVSRQISALETHLGIALFQRMHHHLVLTDAGQSYLGRVRAGLNMLESATAELLAHRGRGGLLNLSAPPTLATSWLIPRLHRFNATNPDVTLNFIHYLHTHDFAMAGLDVAIQYGEGVWPNAVAHYITGRRITAICCPDIAAKLDARDPSSLTTHTRLHHIMVPSLWQEWFDAMGARHLNGAAGPGFDQFSLIIKATLVGFGIGMVPHCLVQDELARGTLVEVFPQPVMSRQGYYLCYPPEKQPLPALQALQRWLLAESEESPSVTKHSPG
jgi:LysR family glycine cleavage system transcriptional activator